MIDVSDDGDISDQRVGDGSHAGQNQTDKTL
jgi:hypothetical protein